MAKPELNATPVPPRNLAESGFDEDESDAVKAVRYGLGMSELHHSPDQGRPISIAPENCDLSLPTARRPVVHCLVR
jgi:hypothetical protein